MKHPAIGKRLLSASEFVRQGAYFADVGTDHAYLPLFLLEKGRIERAVCADINKGPLDSAVKNAKERSLFDKITFVLTDGAKGLSGMGITDYAICGMGGELIAEIIEASPHLSDSSVRLVLQPMTKSAHLYRYLAGRGFRVIGEKYSYECGKYYTTLAAEYSGEPYSITDAEAEFGFSLFNTDARVEISPEMAGYINTKKKAIEKAARGKLEGGNADSPEAQLLEKCKDVFAKLSVIGD